MAKSGGGTRATGKQHQPGKPDIDKMAENLANVFASINNRSVNQYLIREAKELIEKAGGTDFASMFEDTIAMLAKQGKEIRGINIHNDKSESSFSIDMYDKKSGEYVGNMCRSYKKDSSGKVIVHHELFTLQDKYQNSDLGKKLLKIQLDKYKKSNVDAIEVFANINIGGYAWARYGFRMDSFTFGSLRNKVMRNIQNNAYSNQTKTAAMRLVSEMNQEAAKSGTFRNIKQFVDNPKYKEILKPIMIGSSWDGMLSLKDKQNLKEYESYLNGK